MQVRELNEFKDLVIDWDLTPTDAVTMYLEWGNNNWHGQHQPVRSKHDYSVYFVVDNWEDPPTVRLVRRNSEEAVDLAVVDLPEVLLQDWRREQGGLKGVFEPTPEIKRWLRNQLEN